MEEAEKQESSRGESESLLSLIPVIFQNWKAIAKFTAVVTILTGAITFIIPNKYSSTTVILPDIELLNLAQKFGGLQDIASSIGLNLGVTSPSQLYPDILVSEEILKKVIYKSYRTKAFDKPCNLIEYWGFQTDDSLLNYEYCLKKLREGVIEIDVNKKTSIITLSVLTTEPQLSADIANEITTQLDNYQRLFRRTNASEQRVFIEKRLDEVQTELTASEEKLKSFREKNRRITDSPNLMLEEGRLGRVVDLNTAVFVELTKQYELVKLDEIKNTPVVQVLDYARPAGTKSSPKRRIIVTIAFLVGAFFSSCWYVGVDYFNQRKSKHEEFAKVAQVIRLFFEDIRQMLNKILIKLPFKKNN